MKRFITYLLLTLFAGGCIKNDIPLPVVVPRITAMDVEGATAVNIDSEKRKVTITLDETTDIRRVNIRSITFADEATSTSWDITGAQDLSKPIAITLTIYQDYVWTITAEQPIERYFTVNGQVGSSEIDVANRRVVTYVNGSTDLNNISVTSFKLGPKDITTYTPDPSQLHDFSDMVQVETSYHDISEVWNIHIEQTETVVEMVSVDPWTAVVWLKASGVADRTNGFRYRASGAAEWIDVSGEALTVDGGTFSACVEGLQPLTSYECCAYSGDDVTEITTFQTEAAMQMPNSGFETFSNAESSKYSSFYDPASAVAELQTKWWDSGNKGSTTVGSSYTITMPDATDKQEGSYSVKMQSQYVIIKFAAGNIFVGEFDRVIGTSGGVVNFGRPFTLRPRKLSLWLKYKNGPIDRFNGAPDNDPVKEGDMDRCQVFVALGDWDYRTYGGTPDCPVQVNTNDRTTFFKPDSDAVIGYGAYVSDKATDGWIKVEIPIEYRSTSRKPTHIIVSCAASMLGDYFTGSTQSTLWVDGMQLEY